MAETKKVLLINTHLTYPNLTEGKLNDSFIQKAKDFFETKGFVMLETNVEESYNPDQEVEKHLEADIIILQTPVNWFGRTKEDATKQCGTGGLLQRKKFMVCATWNAPAEAFSNSSQQLMQGKSTADLFLNITSNYCFCGGEIMPDYNCHDIYKMENIAKDLEKYPPHLAKVFNLYNIF